MPRHTADSWSLASNALRIAQYSIQNAHRRRRRRRLLKCPVRSSPDGKK